MIIYDRQEGNLSIANAYVKGGLTIIPLRVDGTKQPKIKFAHCFEVGHPWYLAKHWFTSKGNPSGIAILCGQTSANLEVIDFDRECGRIFPLWQHTVEAKCPGLLPRLPIIATPKDGRHVYYRCELIEGNQKLAQAENEKGEKETLIETRGQGGYVVAPGSPPATHPLNKPYMVLQGDLFNVPIIEPEERRELLQAARSFNRYTPPEHNGIPKPGTFLAELYQELYGDNTPPKYGCRPGDNFNAVAEWYGILHPHGWKLSHRTGTTEYWVRPGKHEKGVSATTNYQNTGLMFVFSTNVNGFEAGRTYTKFAAFAILNHNGDFEIAAHALSEMGYGQTALDITEHNIFLSEG